MSNLVFLFFAIALIYQTTIQVLYFTRHEIVHFLFNIIVILNNSIRLMRRLFEKAQIHPVQSIIVAINIFIID